MGSGRDRKAPAEEGEVGEETERKSAAAGFCCGRWWSDIAGDRGSRRCGEECLLSTAATSGVGPWEWLVDPDRGTAEDDGGVADRIRKFYNQNQQRLLSSTLS
jgi:hypothetical protein